MLKKTITYTDYDGSERTEDFLFNMSKAEILEMELSEQGGMKQKLERILQAQDTVTIAKYFKQIVLKAYGEKSPDGKRFIKSDELSEAFSQTEAYSNLYIELATNADEASKFINALFPAKAIDEIRESFEKSQNANASASPALLPNKPE